MRVALNGWFLDRPTTGSGQYLRGLLSALALQAAGHEFLLVTPTPAQARQFPGLSVRVRSLASPLWRTSLGKVLFEQIAFPSECRRWRANVAHVPYWGSPLFSTTPTLVTVHDLIPMLLPAYRGGPLVRAYTALVAASARRADLVLTDSLSSQADIESGLHLPSGRVRCIYLAAGPGFRPEPAAEDAGVRLRYGLPGRYVLYLAGHDVRKNVSALLQAFAVVAKSDDDVTLVVGGALPEPVHRASLLRGPSPLFDPRPLVQALRLRERVQFIGRVDEGHQPALYRGAACAAFLSRYEGFGLPVLEALACGTPVVASNCSSLPELLGDAGFALDPDDTQGQAGAMLACLVDDSLALELRRRGPLQTARFSWKCTAEQTLDAYAAVAAQRAGSGRPSPGFGARGRPAQENPCAY